MSESEKIREATIVYSHEKNQLLITQRGISFEDIKTAIASGKPIFLEDHPNRTKYPHQKIINVAINNYFFVIPFVYVDEQTIFLKTIFPSRKANQLYSKVEE